MSNTSNIDTGADKVTVQKGSVLFKEGDEASHLHVVLTGEVVVVKEYKGRLVPISRLKDKEFVGEASMFGNDRRSASAIATSDTVLIRISRGEITRALGQLPPWVGKLLTTLSDRLRSTTDILKDQGISNNSELALHPAEESAFIRALINFKA